MDRRPERRLLACRLRPALPAAADGSCLRLRRGQHRGPAAYADVAPPVAAPLHRPAQGAPGVRRRHVRAAAAGEPTHLRPRPSLRRRHRALRAQPRTLCAGGRARPRRVRGAGCPRRCSDARPSRGSARFRTCSRSRREGGSGSSCGRRNDDLGRPDRRDARRVHRRAAVVRLEGARGRACGRRRLRGAAGRGDRARRGPLPRGDARHLPARRRRPARRPGRAPGRARARPADPREHLPADPGRRDDLLPGGRGLHRRRRRARDRARDRERADEHVRRVRRGAGPQGLPPPGGGHQPRAGDAPLLQRARFPERAGAARLVRVPRPARGVDARRPPGVRARTGSTGGSWRWTSWSRRRNASSAAWVGSAR